VPRWRRRFGPLASLPGVGRLTRLVLTTMAPGFTRAYPKAPSMLLHANSWQGAYLLRRGLHLPHELPHLIDPDLAREGLRRLEPLRRLAASLEPNPGSDIARVCALESAHYLRNQLLRDADWAGMSQSLEIRVPLVDATLLQCIAPVMGGLIRGAGKVALANAPTLPLPNEVLSRAKTGFAVPTGAWMTAAAGCARSSTSKTPEGNGLMSRRWSRVVLASPAIERQEARGA